MQLQNFAPEKRPLAERIEAREIPPQQLATEILREGDRRIVEMRSQIQELKRDDVQTDVAAYEAELDAAWDDLNKEIAAAQSEPDVMSEESWDMPATEAAAEAKNEIAQEPRSFEDFSNDVQEVLAFGQLDFVRLEQLCAEAEKNDELKEELNNQLEGKVGKKFSERLLRDAEYRDSLKALRSSLDGRLGENGPALMEHLDLKNLIAVKETIGDRARNLAEAIDLTRYAPDLKPGVDPVIMVKEFALDFETGELMGAQVDLGMNCEHSSGEASVFRNFIYSAEKNDQGEIVTTKTVNHELLEFPEGMKQNGTAVAITRECLKEYDSAGIDAITLHANIDIGGYSWASYGYGWDEEVMGLKKFQNDEVKKAATAFNEKQYATELKTMKPDLTDKQIAVLAKERRNQISDLARKEGPKKFAQLDQAEKIQCHLRRVSEMAEGGMLSFIAAAQEAGILDESRQSSDSKVTQIIQAFEEAVAHPENVTPQTLALLGKDGPTLRKGDSGRWYTEEDFAAAIKAGEDKELPDMRGALHAGKISLLGSDWYGKIELKPDGKQGGSNKKLLEKKIAHTKT